MLRTSTNLLRLAPLLALSAACAPAPQPIERPRPQQRPAAERLGVTVYIMSQCPYCVDAVKTLRELQHTLGDALIANVDYVAMQNPDGSFRSLHGESELEGNIAQLCVRKHYPRPEQWLAFIGCQDEDLHAIPGNWQSCADQQKLDRARIGACMTGSAGKALLRASITRASAIQGTPTIEINGQLYEGPRQTRAVLRAVCRHYKRHAPASCRALPSEPKVSLTVLGDARCADCKPREIVDQIRKRFFPALEITELDYGDPRGQALFAQLGLEKLPAFLFGPSLRDAEVYPQLERYVQPRGDYLQLGFPATFDPRAEICGNQRDDDGDGRTDCEDEDCGAAIVCRPEAKAKLDLFLMAQCPYAAAAMKDFRRTARKLNDTLTFEVHLLVRELEGGVLEAPHGEAELAESKRMACARELYPKRNQFLPYVFCRLEHQGDEDWRTCVKAPLEAKKLESCAKSPRAEELLRADAALARDLQVAESPSWVANNRFVFQALRGDEVLRELCRHNAKLSACAPPAP